jgi:hypothetical protein
MAEDNPSFAALSAYLQCLIDEAKGRPFFQCCRTSGRIAALRNSFGGTHLHLWRNPHDQWWSYQVGDYFEATTQLIYGAADLPAPLAAIKDLCRVSPLHDEDIAREFAYARRHRLAAREAYLMFYGLWLYSLLTCEKTADVSVNIDALSTSTTYRETTLSALERHAIHGLDFSDCRIAQAQFGASDRAFFADAEERVHEIFQDRGVATTHLAAALDLRTRYQPEAHRAIVDATAVSSHVRDLAVRQMDLLAQTQQELAQQERLLGQVRSVVEAQRGELAAAATLAQTREQDLAQALAGSNALAAELAEVSRRHAALANDLAETTTRLDRKEGELATSRQRLDRLHEELAAAGSRLEQAGRETHRWWTIADDTSRHLRAIYASRSWRLTAPLREVNAWRKRIVVSSVPGIAAIGSLPHRFVRQLLLAAWAHTQGRPERRAKFVRLLAPFPRLYARLRAFAYARGSAPPAATNAQHQSTLPQGFAPDGVSWDEHPASVRRIHAQLMRARAGTARTTHPPSPSQTPR